MTPGRRGIVAGGDGARHEPPLRLMAPGTRLEVMQCPKREIHDGRAAPDGAACRGVVATASPGASRTVPGTMNLPLRHLHRRGGRARRARPVQRRQRVRRSHGAQPPGAGHAVREPAGIAAAGAAGGHPPARRTHPAGARRRLPGAFTTFSTLAYQTYHSLDTTGSPRALLLPLVSVTAGVLLVGVGVAVGHRVP